MNSKKKKRKDVCLLQIKRGEKTFETLPLGRDLGCADSMSDALTTALPRGNERPLVTLVQFDLA